MKRNQLLPSAILLLFIISGCRHQSATDNFLLVNTTPPPASAVQSLTAVTAAASPPARDMIKLFAGFGGTSVLEPPSSLPITYKEGDIASFWTKNLETNENELIDARLLIQTDALNIWFENGIRIERKDALEAARIIEQHILPTNRTFFGREWQPGIDGDNRLNILHLAKIGGGAAAYFWSGDEIPQTINPYSNEQELLYVGLDNGEIGSEAYYKAIAHEFQHLIQWSTDPNETAWLNEGFGELAGHINEYPVNRANDYVKKTDIQLTDLQQEPGVIGAHYAAAYLFSVYFLDRFGAEATKALVRNPENGRAGFDAVLSDLNTGLVFEDLFADWLAANYLAGIQRGEGVHDYISLDMPRIEAETIRRFPTAGTGNVSQFGADFLRLQSDTAVSLVFTGTQQTPIVDALPHSGDYFWMSLPADESDMSLTQTFDLSNLDGATLSFWTWYAIEEGWDYAYVEASVDDGQTWTLLPTESTTLDNPQGNSFGPGFTGKSGGGDTAVWVQETANLTPFTGQEVTIRFQYITDGAVHGQGFLVDDISIPELSLADDVEQVAGWDAVGFVRVSSRLPQKFLLQSILIGKEDVQVTRLSLDENQRGRWEFPLDKNYQEVILIISGVTPITTLPAAYAYQLTD